MTQKIWIAAWSYDWDEGVKSFKTLAEVEAFMRDSFDLEDDPEPWTKEFWKAVMDAYNEDDWKSFQLFSIDPATGAISTDRPKPEEPTEEPPAPKKTWLIHERMICEVTFVKRAEAEDENEALEKSWDGDSTLLGVSVGDMVACRDLGEEVLPDDPINIPASFYEEKDNA